MRVAVSRMILLSLTITGLLFVSSCKDTSIAKVTRAATKFHTQYNARQFREMYADADPKFRVAISEQDFIAKMESLRRQYGSIEESFINGVEEKAFWQRWFPVTRAQRFIGYNNKCTQGRMQEFFYWNVMGDEAKLIWYETEIAAFNNRRPK